MLPRFDAVRSRTVSLCASLSAEDAQLQSMPDASPAKWHLAHTTWFFETFVLAPLGVAPVDPAYAFLFNSYYEAAGPRVDRARRGMMSRPALADVAAYRAEVDRRVAHAILEGRADAGVVDLGLHHEQQHQELILTDVKHALGTQPLRPALRSAAEARLASDARADETARLAPHARPVHAATRLAPHAPPVDAATRLAPHAPVDASAATRALGVVECAGAEVGGDRGAAADLTWRAHDGGVVAIGAAANDFAFDNERPRHRAVVEPFELASRPASNADVLAFIADGGYRTPSLWLSDGWATVQREQWTAPLYWDGDALYDLAGARAIDPAETACHLSLYEADAIARWAGARLPTEAEWELAASALDPARGHFADDDRFHPRAATPHELFGDVWQWTSSAYAPYPGFRALAGALGEYNGKFMSGQVVLRGGSCFTPRGHVRASYRNFFPPSARWQMTGVRFARDPGANRMMTQSQSTLLATPPALPADDDVLAGLRATHKRLPCRLLYDAVGAQLFEKICTLDAYYPTRTELALLRANLPIIAQHVGPDARVIEPGSGEGLKTRELLHALATPSCYVPIDVAADQLAHTAATLRVEHPGVEIQPVVADYTQPFDLPVPQHAWKSTLVFFPGSTIGNFDPAEARAFLATFARHAGPRGLLLLGADSTRDPGALLRAYDDELGVTAAFNKNVLAHVNRVHGATFDLEAFDHRAVWNPGASRIEMHLVSKRRQLVRVGRDVIAFRADESIVTEHCHKHAPGALQALLASAGWTCRQVFTATEFPMRLWLCEVAG